MVVAPMAIHESRQVPGMFLDLAPLLALYHFAGALHSQAAAQPAELQAEIEELFKETSGR